MDGNIKKRVLKYIKKKNISPRNIEYALGCPKETRQAISELIEEGLIEVNDNFELEAK